MSASPWHIAILIPARNEEDLLPACLHSVLAACAMLPPVVTFDIVVAADRCSDRTASLARQILGANGTVITTDAGVVGYARSLAAEEALKRYQGPRAQCWLANTDADCVVPRTWLLSQLALADKGVEAVTGIVDVDSFVEHDPGVEQRFRSSYIIFEDGSHPHVHGANFGVRADAYRRAEGWSHLATAEDHDLWNRLRKVGTLRQSHASLKVITSARRVGRAPHGFAEALSAHDVSTHDVVLA